MKKLISIFLFPLTLIGGVEKLLIEPCPVIDPTEYKITAYGLQTEGRPTVFFVKDPSEIAKLVAVENSAQFDLKRKAIRTWIFFKDGEVEKVDFHMETPFDTLIFKEDLSSQVKITTADVKTVIETKDADSK